MAHSLRRTKGHPGREVMAPRERLLVTSHQHSGCRARQTPVLDVMPPFPCDPATKPVQYGHSHI